MPAEVAAEEVGGTTFRLGGLLSLLVNAVTRFRTILSIGPVMNDSQPDNLDARLHFAIYHSYLLLLDAEVKMRKMASKTEQFCRTKKTWKKDFELLARELYDHASRCLHLLPDQALEAVLKEKIDIGTITPYEDSVARIECRTEDLFRMQAIMDSSAEAGERHRASWLGDMKLLAGYATLEEGSGQGTDFPDPGVLHRWIRTGRMSPTVAKKLKACLRANIDSPYANAILQFDTLSVASTKDEPVIPHRPTKRRPRLPGSQKPQRTKNRP